MQPYSSAEIADHVQALIRAGQWQPGDRLPYDQLAEQYQVARSAIQRAMVILRERGVVRYRPGRGVFVR